MKKYTFLFLLFLIVVTLGCKKQPDLPTVVNANATVNFTGDPAYDGCGWFIVTDYDQKWHKPVNLDSAYMQNKAKVIVSYVILNDRSYCGQAGVGAGNEQIQIKSITLR